MAAEPQARPARWRAVLHGVEDGVLALLLIAMIALAALQILLRASLGIGLAWVDPVLRIMVLWLGLLGALAASREDRHIAIDVLSRLAGPRLKAGLAAVTGLFTAGVCALIAWHGGRLVAMDLQAGVGGPAGVPSWLFELVIPFSFGLIALRYLARALGSAAALVGDRPA